MKNHAPWFDSNRGRQSQEQASLEQERQKVALAMDRMYDLYIKGEIAAEGFGSRYKPLEEQAKQLDNELPRLQAEVDLLKVSYLSKDQMVNNARDLYDKWPELAHEEKRQVVETITHRIEVGKGELHIDLCYLPGPSENVAKGQHTL